MQLGRFGEETDPMRKKQTFIKRQKKKSHAFDPMGLSRIMKQLQSNENVSNMPNMDFFARSIHGTYHPGTSSIQVLELLRTFKVNDSWQEFQDNELAVVAEHMAVIEIEVKFPNLVAENVMVEGEMYPYWCILLEGQNVFSMYSHSDEEKALEVRACTT